MFKKQIINWFSKNILLLSFIGYLISIPFIAAFLRYIGTNTEQILEDVTGVFIISVVALIITVAFYKLLKMSSK